MASGLVRNQKLVRRVIKQQEGRGSEHQQLIALFPSNLPSWYSDIFHNARLGRLRQGELGAPVAVRDFRLKERDVAENNIRNTGAEESHLLRVPPGAGSASGNPQDSRTCSHAARAAVCNRLSGVFGHSAA